MVITAYPFPDQAMRFDRVYLSPEMAEEYKKTGGWHDWICVNNDTGDQIYQTRYDSSAAQSSGDWSYSEYIYRWNGRKVSAKLDHCGDDFRKGYHKDDNLEVMLSDRGYSNRDIIAQALWEKTDKEIWRRMKCAIFYLEVYKIIDSEMSVCSNWSVDDWKSIESHYVKDTPLDGSHLLQAERFEQALRGIAAIPGINGRDEWVSLFLNQFDLLSAQAKVNLVYRFRK